MPSDCRQYFSKEGESASSPCDILTKAQKLLEEFFVLVQHRRYEIIHGTYTEMINTLKFKTPNV